MKITVERNWAYTNNELGTPANNQIFRISNDKFCDWYCSYNSQVPNEDGNGIHKETALLHYNAVDAYNASRDCNYLEGKFDRRDIILEGDHRKEISAAFKENPGYSAVENYFRKIQEERALELEQRLGLK